MGVHTRAGKSVQQVQTGMNAVHLRIYGKAETLLVASVCFRRELNDSICGNHSSHQHPVDQEALKVALTQWYLYICGRVDKGIIR